MLKPNRIYVGDTRDLLKDIRSDSIHCCVTSPPYWGLRDYGCDGQIGLESTPEDFVNNMVEVFREVRRVLRPDGTLWLNLGDSYATGTTASRQDGRLSLGEGTESARKINRIGTPLGLKTKDLVGIPWRVAFALQADGWWLRQDIIWAKPNPMPESVTDRCTKSHEYIFLLSKSAKYYYDNEAVKEPVAESTIGRGPVSFGGEKGRNYKPDPNDPNFRNGSEQWGRTFDYRKSCKKIKVPSGWDTGKGSHGSFHRDGRGDPEYKTHGKHSTMDKQSSGRRIVENVKKARAAGADHDAPFGDKRNKRSVWTIATFPYKKAHFATFPPKLIEPCILAGCPKGGTVLDPFFGSGTTGFVAAENNRNYIGLELNPDYARMAERRIMNAEPQLF